MVLELPDLCHLVLQAGSEWGVSRQQPEAEAQQDAADRDRPRAAQCATQPQPCPAGRRHRPQSTASRYLSGPPTCWQLCCAAQAALHCAPCRRECCHIRGQSQAGMYAYHPTAGSGAVPAPGVQIVSATKAKAKAKAKATSASGFKLQPELPWHAIKLLVLLCMCCTLHP